MTPAALVEQWREQADAIDNGDVKASHVRAITLRVAAYELEQLDGQSRLIDSTLVSGNLVILDALPIGAVVYMPGVDDDDPAVWIKYKSHVDGESYWRGTEPGVSKTSRHLATFCTPLEVLR